jgi:hypothetical protein
MGMFEGDTITNVVRIVVVLLLVRATWLTFFCPCPERLLACKGHSTEFALLTIGAQSAVIFEMIRKGK